MTQEQENDYTLLWNLALLENRTVKQFLLICYAFGIDLNLYLQNDDKKDYVTIIGNEKLFFGTTPLHSGIYNNESFINISFKGKNYLKWLENEKEKEIIDFKLKKISINQSKYQTVVTFASLAVAIMATVIPLIIFWTDDKKMQIESKDLQGIQQTQKAILQNFQENQKNYQIIDTSVKTLKSIEK